MRMIFLSMMIFASAALAEESLLKSKVVFDYNGKRQMGTVGTRPIVKGNEKTVVVSWLEEVKNGSKSSRTLRIDLNAPNVVFEVPSQKLTLNNKSVEVKTGDKVLGKDGKVYEVAGVFSNGEIALHAVNQQYGKLRTQFNTTIKGSEFIASIEVPCIGYICKDALVLKDKPSQLCSVQRVDYFKNNGLDQDKIPTEKCSRFEAQKSENVLILFQNDTVVTSFQPARNLHPSLPEEDVPVAIGQ